MVMFQSTWPQLDISPCSYQSYRICGNFRGSHISQISCQEDFHISIFADDVPLNDYTALEIFVDFLILRE